MRTLSEILTSETMTAAERRRYRIPLAIAAGVAVVAAGVACPSVTERVHSSLESDKGCATTAVPSSGGLIDAALASRADDKLDLSTTDTALQAALTHAAQQAGEATSMSHPQEVVTCVTYNPLDGLMSGNGGWSASVNVTG
jgi:hypothetical protein